MDSTNRRHHLYHLVGLVIQSCEYPYGTHFGGKQTPAYQEAA